MSESWARRERHTNRLVGAIADHLIGQRSISATQLFGLARLTWVNDDNETGDASYIRDIKLPALSAIFGTALDTSTLATAGAGIATLLGKPAAAGWVTAHTGITNFYSAYRGTAAGWFSENRAIIERIVRSARNIGTDEDAVAIARLIGGLDGIPLPSDPRRMGSGRALTPLVFALDPTLRFPVVNGRSGIRTLLARHRKASAPLPEQVMTMMSYLGQQGIRDAADLDAHATSGDVSWVKTRTVKPGGRVPAQRQATTKGSLTVKDDADQQAVIGESSQTKKQLHNMMTNAVLDLFPHHNPTEGRDAKGRFDVLLEGVGNPGADLLIEVKSSVEDGAVRMAIGQLVAYRHHLQPKRKTRWQSSSLPDPPNTSSPCSSHFLLAACGFKMSNSRDCKPKRAHCESSRTTDIWHM